MEEYKKTYEQLIFNYYVLFETDNLDVDYNAIVDMQTASFSKTTHIWDSELSNISNALWYILHLPRMGLDVTEMDIELVLSSHDTPHNIIPIPYSKKETKFQRYINENIVNPAIIICDDGLYDTVINDQTIPKSILGTFKVLNLTSNLLQKHWNELGNHIHKHFPHTNVCTVDSNFRLTNNEERKILPLIPFANQLGYTHQLITDIKKINEGDNANIYMLAMRRRILDTCEILSKEDKKLNDKLKKQIKENSIFNGVPLIVTMPGIMSYQIKNYSRKKILPEQEKDIINILGYHRAIAKNGLCINVENVTQEMYTELAKLEEHCKDNCNIDNHFIWRSLRKIGNLINSSLEKIDIDIIHSVSQITVFSDFPIGLGILPDCSAPLCCIKPITYKPLTPLTKAFQYEMKKGNQVYLGKKCKVVIAECIEETDGIRSFCDGLSHVLKEMVDKTNDMTLYVENITSIREFKDMLKRHDDADVLLISAHGKYEIECNMAGLVIGDEVWLANDNDIQVPPVVLLSACHVMPRGRGVVTVGDMLIRVGAKTVLGTFIPVDVYRNSVLIVRLFTNIIEVRNGWSNMQTLDQIWSHVVSTNAMHEIIASDLPKPGKLELWANTKNERGKIPQKEFKDEYSVGKLRSTHIYEDTEKVLLEIAEKDGIDDYFKSVINTKGYFPESVFYQFIGNPENIFIRNNIMERYHNNINNEY